MYNDFFARPRNLLYTSSAADPDVPQEEISFILQRLNAAGVRIANAIFQAMPIAEALQEARRATAPDAAAALSRINNYSKLVGNYLSDAMFKISFQRPTDIMYLNEIASLAEQAADQVEDEARFVVFLAEVAEEIRP